jgi:hypothetical protein
MKTELVLFGMRLNMASRVRRRWLVVLFYGVFGALLLLSWMRGARTGAGFLTIEFTLLIGPILGGYFAGRRGLFGVSGLVAPFVPRKTLKYPDSASILRPHTLLHPVVDNDPELRADERAMSRRDSAHYTSHGFLGTVFFFGFMLEYSQNTVFRDDLKRIGISSNAVNQIIFLLLQSD